MTDQAVHDHLSLFAKWFNVDQNHDLGMWLLYGTIVILCFIVYQLGFARKLPVLKAAVIYALLLLGCTLLTFFAIFLPVAEALFAAAVVLAIYKFRLLQSKKAKKDGRFTL
ncbi:YlaH-like family protein [Heyndrickxia acidiproducens]|jgi:hypothetical protein|uniref:YlaH-like family protein n=1 Tax=Heyndrickxia acidiproducens TaxID=1121084 RepID=UPI000376611F|nr:YlaH-like family protein [Heyndrickxia acidiproducens]